MGAVLEFISFSYGERVLFKDFSLVLGPESPLVILGPSGCGKTSLFRIIAGQVGVDAGRVVRPGRGVVSMVFQEPRLLPWRTALENVRIPLESQQGKAEATAQASRYLAMVGLQDRLHSYPGELSGGQRQRVSIARAFAYPSDIVLMDEPFQSLDLPLRIQLMDLIQDLLELSPRTLAVVTHDPREAIYLGNRIVVLSEAPVRILFDRTIGTPRSERSYASPGSAELESLLFKALTGSLDSSYSPRA